ncbi:MAG: PKD domain-containing protein, partial [Bacteroidota bacterium]
MSGTSPLAVQFTGSQSYDPNGDNLTYSWDFGNGGASNEQNPQYTFTTGGNNPQRFDVTLTVSDGSLSSTAELTVSLNNTAPVINSTSIDNINSFSYENGRTLNLSANVSDAEHSTGSLQFQWIVELHHNDHFHQEPAITSQTATTVLSPIGCDGATYWYRVKLIVTDPAGLFSIYEKDIFPNCPGSNQ